MKVAFKMNVWVIVLTALWLTPDICDDEVKIKDYNLSGLTETPGNMEQLVSTLTICYKIW